MLSLAIHNFEKGEYLIYDKVLSGAEIQLAGKAYSFIIQAEGDSGIYHINTQLHMKPSHLEISLFEMICGRDFVLTVKHDSSKWERPCVSASVKMYNCSKPEKSMCACV